MTDKLRAAAEAALEEWHTEPGSVRMASLMIALSAALAERTDKDSLSVAEPVAWGMRHSDGRIYDCIAPGEHDREPGQYTVPLYAHPPRREWVGLTDEEIATVLGFSEHTTASTATTLRVVSRAIEAALKEKNHD